MTKILCQRPVQFQSTVFVFFTVAASQLLMWHCTLYLTIVWAYFAHTTS